MKQKLHLHIGFDKTGTTSFQKHLASRTNSFNFIGRRYDGSDQDILICDLARSLALNSPREIEKLAGKLVDRISADKVENNLVSNENLLRPYTPSVAGLRHLIEILREKVDLEVYISSRQLNLLLLSRFRHDLRRIGSPRRVALIPNFFLGVILKNALCLNFECAYPYCSDSKIKCHCGKIKKISIDYYDHTKLEGKLGVNIKLLDLFGKSNSDFVFDEPVFPLPIFNESEVQISKGTKTYLLKIINNSIKELKKSV